jgi:phage shock protein E
MNIEQLVRSKQCTVVDVRTRGEFMGGHVAGAVNIPLQDLQSKLVEIRQLKQPLVLCCASGNRSGQAQRYLAAEGINCVNGGSWFDVNSYSA